MSEVGGGQPWEQLKLTWERRRNAPCKLYRGTAVADGSLAYFSSFQSDEVFGYSPGKDDWSKLPECPQSDFGLAVINDLITAVGGKVDGQYYTNCLSSFSGGEWVTVFPPMPTKRYWPAVISAQNYLIAVGGWGVGGRLSTVEVMDMSTLEWYTAASLPEPVSSLTATVCGGHLYLLGGYGEYGNEANAVFTCTLDSLIRSCHPPSRTPPHTSKASVWQRVTDVPVVLSTCITLNGRVMTVSGRDSHGPTPAVYMYNPESNVWQLLENMPTARSRCLVVRLRDYIIAVGGLIAIDNRYRQCATVEVCYLQLSGLDLESVDGTTVLDEDDLRDVRSAVADLSGRWQDLGVSLGIHQGNLKAIISDNPHSSSDCLGKVLTLWLRQNYKVEEFGKPTWRRLVEAVKDHNLALAQTIAREHHVDRVALKTALEKERMMPLCIAQCMTVGAPQTGKSSLKRRLLKQMNQPSMSTGVAEKPVVCAVTVDGSEWTVLQWKEEGAQLLQGIKQLPSKENPETNQLPTPSVSIPEDTEDSRDKSHTDNFPRQHPSSNSESSNVEVDMNLNEPKPSSYSELIDTILDVGSEKWIAAKKRLENQCTIYFTDTGGQLEFQEVLPAIISGPSIFLLVFNLEHAAEGLDKEFPAVYKRSDGSVYEPPPGMSTFTVRDLILHVLASIQSTRSYQFQKDGNERVIEAKVLLVGTHSDRVTDASVRNQIESDVQKLLKDTPYYKKGMLQVPCRKRRNEKFVYMVNNESSEDPAFQEIREKVRSLIFKKSGDSDYKENISAYWLGFDLMLRWPGKPEILKYERCVDLARRCGIKDDVEQVLTFLHKRFGIIRYFQGEGLGDIVITNPQVIYDMLSNLIAEKFKDSDSNCNLTPEQVEEFQDKGLISEDAVKCIAPQWSETPDLSLQFLLNLLSHLHIVVKLQGDEFDPDTKYFIPCVLAGTICDLSTPEDISEPIVADLLILFDDGRQYCPKGLFSVLVIKLAQKPKQHEAKYTWVLNREELSREGVVFHVKVMDSECEYSYAVHIQHGIVGSRSMLRIFIEKLYSHSSREQVCCLKKNLESVCKEIRDSVKSAIKSSLDELHKSTKLCIGFYSTCDKNQTSSESHIAIVKDLFQQHSGVPEDMTCIDCRKKICLLEEEHKVWFKEVPQELDPRSQGSGTARPRIASAQVRMVQSPAQPLSLLPSGQQPSIYQTPPAQQQQNPQTVTPNQVQQPLDRLTTEDLYILTSILKAAAPQWQAIGGALGFVNDDLIIIQCKPPQIQEGVTGYFREMLSQWLKWAPPNHDWPTITALKDAVRDSGHESLAYNFREQFLLKKAHPSPPPPSSTAATGSGTTHPDVTAPLKGGADYIWQEVEVVEEEHLVFSGNEERTFDRRKGQGFILIVPKGAISSGDCTVEVKSCVVGQQTLGFTFPEGSKLASAVYHITASRELSKPVFFQIQHCAVIKGDSRHTQLEMVIADSTTGPPYNFKPYTGGNVRVFDSYIEVELEHFCFITCLFDWVKSRFTSVRYCGLICCLKSSELTRSWEYHIVLIKSLRVCITAVNKEYKTAEKVEKLIVEFEEGEDALTLEDISAEGTTTNGGWRISTRWDPARITKREADEFTGRNFLPHCCVLASCTREAATVGPLRHVLKFSGTITPKSYLLCRDTPSERSTSVSSGDGATRPSTPTPEMDVSGVDNSPLGEQDLLDIQSAIIEVAARWKRIGDMFRLSPGTLDTIGINHSDAEDCLREMILRWLRKSGYDSQQYGLPTWSWVVKAVGSSAGGNNPELARRIADQHPKALPSSPPPSSTAATGSGTAHPRIGDQPTLIELIRFRGRESRINIPQQISTNFKKFGILLLEDQNGTRIQSIIHKCRDDPEEITMEVLQEWIAGRGKLPVSWDTLIKVLRDIDLGTLADDIAAVK